MRGDSIAERRQSGCPQGPGISLTWQGGSLVSFFVSRTQTNRKLAILTPSLGEDVLLLKSFSGSEQMGRLFHFEVELRSEDHELKFEDVVGEKACVRLDLPTGETRFFHGHVSRFVQMSPRATLACYQATIVPWLWFLTRRADCRIFQGMTVPDILKKVFEGAGFNDFELSLNGTYRTWDFCVQYRETDFNFVSRLMEQEGIYYFFKHEEEKHTLVLADASSAHSPFPGFDTILYRPEGQMASELGDITEWMAEKKVQPGAYAMNDFNCGKPATSLLVKKTISRQHSHSEFEIYDYPGEYTSSGEGDVYAKVRIEELQAQHEVLSGKCRAAGLSPGCTFKLDEHPRDDQNREYLVTAVQYEGRGDDYETTRMNGEGGFFACNFTAIPAAEQFRPPRITPKPVIQGPQTAIVTGPGGEEIHTDANAQVKVQFHWDREGKHDQNSSCWVRVSQLWAGSAWGGIHIPRIGQEVIVEFLEGDPDRPIITGRVYNGQAAPPYELPAKKTQSGIKSDSTIGGGGSNEMRFEDKKGEEQIYIHAQKDKKVMVENDRNEEVGHNETIKIGNDRGEEVGNDEAIKIGNNRSEDVSKNETISIGENRSTSVGNDEELSVGNNRKISVGKDESLSVTGNRTKSVSKDETISVTGARQETVGKNNNVTVKTRYLLDVGDEILIQTGDASILMKKNGDIQIKGKNLTLEGSGKINIKASSDLVMKGSKIGEN